MKFKLLEEKIPNNISPVYDEALEILSRLINVPKDAIKQKLPLKLRWMGTVLGKYERRGLETRVVLNKSLLDASREVILEVFLHEFAHFVVDYMYMQDLVDAIQSGNFPPEREEEHGPKWGFVAVLLRDLSGVSGIHPENPVCTDAEINKMIDNGRKYRLYCPCGKVDITFDRMSKKYEDFCVYGFCRLCSGKLMLEKRR